MVISVEQGQAAVDAALAKARAMGIACCVAIVDDAGHLTLFKRMDDSSALNVDIAVNKAHTAAGLGMSTADWYEFIQTQPALAAGSAAGIERMIIFGGGVPIRWSDQVIGAIGVAGGRPDQDVQIAEAGVAAIQPRRAG
jgi:uncharacterized protein GlcG (DUF336 family)